MSSYSSSPDRTKNAESQTGRSTGGRPKQVGERIKEQLLLYRCWSRRQLLSFVEPLLSCIVQVHQGRRWGPSC